MIGAVRLAERGKGVDKLERLRKFVARNCDIAKEEWKDRKACGDVLWDRSRERYWAYARVLDEIDRMQSRTPNTEES